MKKIIILLFSALIFGFSFICVQAVAKVDEESVISENNKETNTENTGEDVLKDTTDKIDYSNYTEEIESFNVNLEINKNSSINIEENITYNFNDLERHGIYRDITYKYKARGGNYKLRISNIDVVDEQGNNYNFKTSKSGDDIRIKIGDADKYVTGIKTYVISYTVQRAINYFDNHDELYWNVTGVGWQVPIGSSQAEIKLPEGVSQDDLQLKCFTGGYGSTDEHCSKEIINEKTVLFRSDNDLSYYEGLTIVLGWPKGLITEPSLQQKIIWIVSDNWYLGLPFLVLIFSFLYWRARGKDPKGSGTIIAHYEAPDNLTPAEVGTIYDNRADNKDVTATLIQLAIKGHLKIKQYGKGRKDYKFIKLKDGKNLKNDFEKKLLNAVFDSGDEKKLNDMKNKFYKEMNDIKKNIYKNITDKGYYSRNPKTAKFGLLFVLGFFAIFGSIFLGSFFSNFYLGAALLVSGFIMIIFSMFMSQKTIKGAKTLEKIKGFKEFLKVTEKERLKFHNPPDMIPELFEKYLPYAMVLGVENKWAQNFKNIYEKSPDWYEGYNTNTWTALALVNSLSSFSTNSQSVMASAPSSASGGGSGFSGGGAGGGFGGGGGGSW